MKKLPENVAAYRRTPEFTERTVPQGLLGRHSTKPGTWGKIVVLTGRLNYRILQPIIEEHELCPRRPGIVEPTIEHEVRPLGNVTFYVEFYRKTDD